MMDLHIPYTGATPLRRPGHAKRDGLDQHLALEELPNCPTARRPQRVEFRFLIRRYLMDLCSICRASYEEIVGSRSPGLRTESLPRFRTWV